MKIENSKNAWVLQILEDIKFKISLKRTGPKPLCWHSGSIFIWSELFLLSQKIILWEKCGDIFKIHIFGVLLEKLMKNKLGFKFSLSCLKWSLDQIPP